MDCFASLAMTVHVVLLYKARLNVRIRCAIALAVAAGVVEHVQKPARQINRVLQLEGARMHEIRSDRLSRPYVIQFIFVRAVPLQHTGSTRTEGVADMSEQPSNGMPDWLTTDMLVIAVSLAIIVVGIWIAP